MGNDGGGAEGVGERALVVASRYNEGVTRKLVNGAVRTLKEAGFRESEIDVYWVPGAFELPLAVDRGLSTGAYRLAVAVGAVIRGETPHFDYVSLAATQGLARVELDRKLPVGFGVLTCDDQEQALARAGGAAGNKGAEAAASAVELAQVIRQIQDGPPLGD